jgi:hypothetical protein
LKVFGRASVGDAAHIEDARIEAVIVRTLETKPPDATHWSARGMARTGGCQSQQYSGYGAPSACSRIGRRLSSS